MHSFLLRPRVARTAAVVAVLGAAFSATPAASAGGLPADRRIVSHVFAATNDSSGNTVQVFDRYAGGRLSAAGIVPTGGLGSGASLGSQGGLARDGHLIFAVNAGSDSVSALAVTAHGLVLRDTLPTRGDRPVSVTTHDGVGYVLNQGSDTIAGFRYSAAGRLSKLPDSVRRLTPNPEGGATEAAQVSFTPDGSALLVTEKASNNLDTFVVRDGYAGRAMPHASAGVTPYGFDFDPRGHAIVSEATTGSASSYLVRPRRVSVISAAVPDGQAAACWLVVTGDGGIAYVVNAASGSISSYAVSKRGSLRLLDAVAAAPGAGATDAALSADGRSLYVRLGGGVISSWAIGGDGALTSLGSTQGAAAYGPAGLVAD